MNELQAAKRLHVACQKLAGFQNRRIIARDFVSAAAGKKRNNRALRINSVERCKFLAVHGWPDDIRKGMADKVHRHPGIAINLLFEGEDDDHAAYQTFDDADASGSPRPYLRPDEIANWNARVFQPTSNA